MKRRGHYYRAMADWDDDIVDKSYCRVYIPEFEDSLTLPLIDPRSGGRLPKVIP